MKGRVAALGEIDGRRAAGLLVDGVLQDFLIEPVEDMPTPGAIYRAICDRPLKGQGGMMLRLPEGTAFLRQGKGLRPGQSMLVQVTGYADEGKATPVTHKPLFKSRFAIVTPDAPGLNISRSIKDEEERARLMGVAHEIMAGEEFGLIVRSSAMGADPDEVAEDIDEMFQLALQVMGDAEGSEPELILEGPDPHHMAWREWDKPDLVASDEDAFENHGILDALEDFRSTYVRLSGGASMYVEPTRALIAVDVNTGGDTSPAAGLKANLAVVKELPKQLRIRGLGGQITIDFAPMAKKDRRQLESAMRTAFRADSIDTAMVDWTPLGHYELQRKRERMPLGVSF
ncbi:ribonuclease E/G [Cochlodiniinecator piscidefendens]|uniref:ribonuclease E/G n=1 Tax=Cochlodiniinecator piscidefendens TaxID=2715756 RepID=UPI00140B1942|nr:ribonuclease E/G [Cochlodiniinecator piscidefendens]